MVTNKELEQDLDFMNKYVQKGADLLTGGIQDVVQVKEIAITLRKSLARLSGVVGTCDPSSLKEAIDLDDTYGLAGAVVSSNALAQMFILNTYLDILLSELVRQCDVKLATK